MVRRCGIIYAIVETGGKQYKISPGQVIDVDRIGAPAGDTVELDRVLLIDDDGKMMVGTPTIEGAKVLATYRGEGKGDKIIVFRYKSKVRYRKKTGHRLMLTKLEIDKIVKPGAISEEPVKKVRRPRKEVTESGT
tara:strand:- start:12470 stop:12874 length:405 start_codon:yes stop_codon:yes gene_type:complete